MALPTINFDGGGGLNSLVIGDSAAGAAWRWQIDGAGGGTVARDGIAVVAFTGVAALGGGAGHDTLSGPQADTLWQIGGAGAGSVAGTAFAGFERLAGAADNEDTFSLAPGGAMADGVDGGAGGFDSLILEGDHIAVRSVAFDASSGTVALDSGIIAYTGLEPITLSGDAATLTLTLSGMDDKARLEAGPAAGQLQLVATGTAETQIFNAPTGMLTIDLGGGTNTLVVAKDDLPGLLATIPGYDVKVAAAFLGIDASVAMRGAKATLTLDGATVTGSGSVQITGESTERTEVDAIGIVGAASNVARFHAAAGYARAEAVTVADIKGATTINAVGDVVITTLSTSSAIASAVASGDAGVGGAVTKVDAKATSVAVAIARNNLIATTTVASTASITSGGSVNILATGQEETSTNAETQARDSGLAGISVGLAFDNATVLATVDGSVTAAGLVNAKGRPS